jgi:hypothetical protein
LSYRNDSYRNCSRSTLKVSRHKSILPQTPLEAMEA